MNKNRISIEWSRLLGFQLADSDASTSVECTAAGAAPVGASANLSISGLGAKIGSKQWVRLTD